MSVDNAVYILLDKAGKCVVYHDRMSNLDGLITDRRNPWTGDRDFRKIYCSIYGKKIYRIDAAMDKAVKMLNKLEACEYGIVTIPLEVHFDKLKQQYLSYMQTLLNNFSAVFTDDQRHAVRQLAVTGLFKDMLITEQDGDFCRIYAIAEHCFGVYGKKRDRKWNREAESWLKENEALLC